MVEVFSPLGSSFFLELMNGSSARLPGEGWMVRESYQWSANSSQLYKASIFFFGKVEGGSFLQYSFLGSEKKVLVYG